MTGASSAAPLIRLEGISKRFGSLWANRDVSMEIRQGEVHALAGENGAGKSTLVKILYGHFPPDSGRIVMKGSPVVFRHPRDAVRRGIGMVHQHLLVFPQLTALENIVAGAEPHRRGILDREEARRLLVKQSQAFGFRLPLEAPARELAHAHHQQIELLRALHRGASVLILDEPTSLLAPSEVDQLLELLARLRDRNHTILFISHRLPEVFRVADRLTILSHGRRVATLEVSQTSPEETARLITDTAESPKSKKISPKPGAFPDFYGRPAESPSPPAPAGLKSPRYSSEKDAEAPSCGNGDPTFEISEIPPPKPSRQGNKPTSPLITLEDIVTPAGDYESGLKGISLEIRRGEILGIGCVVGNGESMLAKVLTGAVFASRGRLLLDGRDITRTSLKERMEWGLRWLPGDPFREALLPSRPLWENVLLGHHRQRDFQARGWLKKKVIRQWAARRLDAFRVKWSDLKAPVQHLSGGNQQKAVLSRVLVESAKFIVLEQPGRGLDLPSREHLHQAIGALNDRDVTFALFSYDLEELVRLCHRVGILFRGRLVGLARAEAVDRETLGRWVLGLEAT